MKKHLILLVLILFYINGVSQVKPDSTLWDFNTKNNKQDIWFSIGQRKKNIKYKAYLVINENDTIHLKNDKVIKVDNIYSGELIIYKQKKKKRKTIYVVKNIEKYIKSYGVNIHVSFPTKILIGNKYIIEYHVAITQFKTFGCGVGHCRIFILNLPY